MTSRVAARIENGIGMAPSTAVDYEALADSVEAPEAKLLVEACRQCQSADYQALGLGNNFGDGSEIRPNMRARMEARPWKMLWKNWTRSGSGGIKAAGSTDGKKDTEAVSGWPLCYVYPSGLLRQNPLRKRGFCMRKIKEILE
ncbi:MAG: hypothetical protein ACLRXA_23025 [Clostridium sp.]